MEAPEKWGPSPSDKAAACDFTIGASTDSEGQVASQENHHAASLPASLVGPACQGFLFLIYLFSCIVERITDVPAFPPEGTQRSKSEMTPERPVPSPLAHTKGLAQPPGQTDRTWPENEPEKIGAKG